jgi:hypothetical protein
MPIIMNYDELVSKECSNYIYLYFVYTRIIRFFKINEKYREQQIHNN